MKVLVFLAALIAAHTVSFGQSILLKAGTSLSSIHFRQTENYGSRVGAIFGVGYSFSLNESISLQPEIQFVQKGNSYAISTIVGGQPYTYDYKMRLNYLEVPVLLKRLFTKQKIQWFVEAGPYIGIGLGGRIHGERLESGELHLFDRKIRFTESSNTNSLKYLYFDNRYDVGMQVGAGAVVHKRWTLDFRYAVGALNLVDRQEYMTSKKDAASKNRCYQLSLAMPIRFSH